ncbi:hypothetical protein [Capnocytophaga sp.]|uniref:hypothetical protein n=1 Tax=Capnocytophaga sp. TaxID=44737 RepID=UPI0026DBB211|nr:hypothetical protein [Capnocytophaga sp.]MDO5104621.1 hypothetical protein [Capnocytophaga sp.]
MKTKLSIITILYSFLGFSQPEKKYILFDELLANQNVMKYTLDTQKMYDVKGEIELYNILSKSHLLLVTIFPDTEKQNSWEEISFDAFQKQIIPINKFRHLINSSYKEKFFNDFQIVKKEGNAYFVAKNNLFEVFKLFNSDTTLRVSGKNVINTRQKIQTYQDIRKTYLAEFQKPFPMDGNNDSQIITLENELKTIYLSSIEEVKNEKIYRFWTFDDWHKGEIILCGHTHKNEMKTEDYNYHRGIDRFAYIEGKGIVGGSYDFYFDRTGYGFKRVVRHDIMWAKELFLQRQ